MTTPILFDCDTGIDDSLAILYGAAHGADLRACTVTHGNVPVATGARNTVTILDALALNHVPVFLGAARPMAQPLSTAEFVHGEDGLGNSNLTPSLRTLAGDMAATHIVRLAREHPGELTLVAVGPLTNLGLALLLEPRLPELVDRVVIMGGAIETAGNASETGEANVWHDPEAAQLVVDAPWDVLFVGLEITMRTPLSDQSIARIATSTDPRAKLAWKIMQKYLDVYEPILGARTCVLHDPMAMALALDPDLATYRTAPAFVELGTGRTRGMLVPDLRRFDDTVPNPHAAGTIRFVDTLDTATFHERFLEALGA